jgi:hypothetical protein
MKSWTLAFALAISFSPIATAQTWTVGNTDIVRSISFTPSTGLATDQLTDLRTHTDFILHTPTHWNVPQEFTFECNGHRYNGAGSQFALVDASDTPFAGRSLTIILRAKDVALEVAAVYRVYDGHAAVRKHLVLRNTGSSPLLISHLNLESIAPSVGCPIRCHSPRNLLLRTLGGCGIAGLERADRCRFRHPQRSARIHETNRSQRLGRDRPRAHRRPV